MGIRATIGELNALLQQHDHELWLHLETSKVCFFQSSLPAPSPYSMHMYSSMIPCASFKQPDLVTPQVTCSATCCTYLNNITMDLSECAVHVSFRFSRSTQACKQRAVPAILFAAQ